MLLHANGYRTVEELNRTSGTTTYRARRERDGLPVLLKVLRTDYSRTADIARFRHEFGLVQRLESSRVVRVLDVEDLADGLAIVLEDFRGHTLRDLLRERKKVPVSGFFPIALAAAEAIADVHRHNLVHRDVKPRSIVVDAEGTVKLTDFGIASLITRENEESYNPTVLEETLPYISPEQSGRMNRSIDYRTDLYSLGAVFYEILTGERAFSASDPSELIHAHLAVAPTPPRTHDSHIPEALSSIVLKLLSKNAEDRYHSAAGLVADLRECEAQWNATGRITDFVPGRHDRSDLFQIHQKLYGRERDTEELIESFNNVLGGRREVVMISGYSGIGKSSLVHEILKPLARERGYYISGKYDQYNRDTPYSAFIQAFDGLVKQLLTESEERLARWKEQILEAVGNNGQILCDVIPLLKHIIGEQPPVPALGPVESQNRFNMYFQKFVSVFARPAHPLALFIDDLQWVDTASLGLMRTLLGDNQSECLFFAGAYRDNEVSPAHPFVMATKELQSSGVHVRDIVLTPLKLGHLVELMTDSLKRGGVDPLAEVVLRKTGGNPFFVKQFMRYLYEKQALIYDTADGWHWDLSRTDSLQYTENVVALMAETIRNFAGNTQDVLKLAAAIGNRFDLTVLATVAECSVGEVYGRLDLAINEGLVQPGEQYRFAHDKIQEAAYSLIPESQRAAFHHRIGQLLLRKLNLSEGQNLFDIVGHLNAAGELVRDPDECVELARLNLRAAERAEESAAFGAALKYLEYGVTKLPADAWTSQYQLSLGYYMRRGVMESLCERHDDALKTLAEAYEHAQGRLDRTEVRRLKMNVQVLKNDLVAALDEGLAAIKPFGIDLPPFPSDEMLAAELDAFMKLMEGRHPLSLADLPVLNDPEISALQNVLQEMFAPCYFLATNNFGITVMRILTNTIKHGVSKNTIYACVNFGTFLTARMQIDLGYQFGRAAVRVNEVHPDKKSEAMLNNMWGAFVQHWKESYPAYKESLLKGLHSGIETGQYIWAFYNTVNSNTNSFLRGASIPDIVSESKAYLPLWKMDKFNAITWMVGAIGQICHNLTHPVGERGDDLKGGEWIDIDVIIDDARRINNQASLFFANFYRVINGLFRGAYVRTAEVAWDTDPSIVGIASWHGNPGFHFYGGLTFTQAADQVDAATRDKYVGRVADYVAKLETWAGHCPENHQHRFKILAAELERVRGNTAAASALFDEGIALARDGRYVQDEALANEFCARHYAALGRPTLARAYMTEAYRLYARWGATETLKRLVEVHNAMIERDAIRRYAPQRGEGEAAPALDVDVGSVFKASQAILGEIVMPRLLEKLMQIILHNAGAQKGFLILRDGNRLRIEAEGSADRDEITVLQSIPVDPSDRETDVMLSSAIVHYVARTLGSVVLADATNEGAFTKDAYVASCKPRSVLCMPLVRQGNLKGVLYLENNLATNAFTTDRIQLLSILCAQMAISIENANLYAGLERAVTERTSQLREAQARVVKLEKEATEAQMAGGVAHEMRNALTGAKMFLSQVLTKDGVAEPHSMCVDNSRKLQSLYLLLRNHLPGEARAEASHMIKYINANEERLHSALCDVDDAVGRALKITHLILDYSRLSEQSPGDEPVKMQPLIEAIVRESADDFAANGIDVRLEIPSGCVLYGKQVHYYSIFKNLVVNARDALVETEDRSGRAITVRFVEEPQHALLEVVDTGIGIPEPDRARIFEPFFSTKPETGTGLGLGMVQKLVALYQGSIELTTEVRRGTKFGVRFPLKSEQLRRAS